MFAEGVGRVLNLFFVSLLGKNILNGNISPTKLKMMKTINGGSNEDCDSGGRVALRATQPKKYAGTNQKAYQDHLCSRLYAVAEMTMRKKAKPKSDKPPPRK
jgi:hypothetical protein